MELEPHATSLLPSQQQLVLRIQHLAGLDSNLVIVAGREGAGKETLSSAIVEQYSNEFDVAWLPLNAKSTDSVIRSQILNQLFVDTAYDPDAPLQQSINDILGEQGGKQLIVLNHSERLSNQLLVELWSVVENSRKLPAGTHHIAVLLFAEPSWANRVSQEMAAITDADQPVLQIPPLPLDERKQLFVNLQQRLEQESQDVDLFERQLDEQDGLPGEVVDLCSNTTTPVIDPQADEQPADSEPRKFPIAAIAMVAMCVFIALILMWAFSNSQDSNQPQASIKEQSTTQEAVAATEPSTAADQQGHNETHPNSDDNLASLPAQLPAETFTTQVDDESQKQRIELDEKTLDKIAEKIPDAASESTTELADTAPVDVSASNEASSITPDISEPVAPSLPAPEPQQTELQPTEQQAQPVDDAITKEPTPAVQPWWHTLNSNHYVLQLGVMSSDAGLIKFAKRYGLTADPKFRHYQSQRNGKPVFIGVYGDYPSSVSARSAIKTMAPAVQKLSPWPKSVAKVQQEVQNP
ncbi:hypothetical protein K0504_03130 [Neiella marina]|uniref:ORC1/DEAH AAA+ ATPase domain-containing protein n=1 Tax=Neiella holothuriorum TaxID=2870530 RepID=A0ABS7EDW5_9GAMM|nr:AAA family ATPase [Neiella holothuriorum]MBW8190016.1 hypothetical protein [Neiella holothuriorum]